MSQAEVVLGKLEGVVRNGSDWKARCPVTGHGRGLGGRNPSLSVRVDDGKVSVRCWAGCDINDVLSTMGLGMDDLIPPGREMLAHPPADAVL